MPTSFNPLLQLFVAAALSLASTEGPSLSLEEVLEVDASGQGKMVWSQHEFVVVYI